MVWDDKQRFQVIISIANSHTGDKLASREEMYHALREIVAVASWQPEMLDANMVRFQKYLTEQEGK